MSACNISGRNPTNPALGGASRALVALLFCFDTNSFEYRRAAYVFLAHTWRMLPNRLDLDAAVERVAMVVVPAGIAGPHVVIRSIVRSDARETARLP